MVKVTTDVKGARRVTDNIEEAIEDGIEYGAGEVSQEAKEIAQERIRSVGAIFTGDLITQFNIDYQKKGNSLWVSLNNKSDHAAPIEYGAEYTEKGPPLAPLIPWVEAKMIGFTVPEDDLDDLPDPPEVEEDTSVPEPDGSFTDLTNVVDDDTLDKAFWLQQHIKEEGIDAVGYMRMAEQWVDDNAADTIEDAIMAQL